MCIISHVDSPLQFCAHSLAVLVLNDVLCNFTCKTTFLNSHNGYENRYSTPNTSCLCDRCHHKSMQYNFLIKMKYCHNVKWNLKLGSGRKMEENNIYAWRSSCLSVHDDSQYVGRAQEGRKSNHTLSDIFVSEFKNKNLEYWDAPYFWMQDCYRYAFSAPWLTNLDSLTTN